MLDQHPAAGAERKAFDVMVLCRVRGDVEHCLRRRLTSPIASRLIFPEADRYASINAGDIVSAPAMLSKPRVESSGGRNCVASTSSASRSRITLAYSVPFRRWSPGAGRCSEAGVEAGPPRSGSASPSWPHPAGAHAVGGIIPAQLANDVLRHLGWSARRARSNWALSRTRPPVLTRAL